LGKTPLDYYVPCVSVAFKQIKNGSGYYRRIIIIRYLKALSPTRTGWKKRLGIILNQCYVNKVTTMLNSGMIPLGKSDIMHWIILGKTRAGEEIWN